MDQIRISMKTIKGPAIFLAQFMDDKEPFNNLKNICAWLGDLGYKGVQIPTWDGRCIDLAKAAESKDYADEIKGIVAEAGMEITELSTHLQGQLVAVHPAYDELFDGFAPPEYHKNPSADRKSVVLEKRVSDRVDLGGRRSIKKTKQQKPNIN